ncbi:hypothetical protein NKR19_g8892 [Coniochaeta hoffmannii]|uniref:Ribosome maturation protein SDO1/SBDS N-terminal domain-containing protein n=1 Tax=Coniochaeta hoffmannii TaxID=91930 RepID=A0AA38VBW3_9PEZI|nr:hypothetical protein NKR19_g8892 [Coniochaeta hoffmannii]
MARGGQQMTRVHYKGKNDDFFVFLDSVEDFKKWLKDSTVPLAQVVRSFKVFCTHKHGNQGMYDAASNADLDNEFGTHVDAEVIEKILREGTLTEGHMVERNGPRNDANGGWTSGINNQGGGHQ